MIRGIFVKHVDSRLLVLLPLLGWAPAFAQAPSELQRQTEADHAQMMQQLGITQLRKGPSGDEKAPDHANYDESIANPYPNWPDPLRMNDGSKVTTAAQWNSKRRPQIIEDFEREVLGRVPAVTPAVVPSGAFVSFWCAKSLVARVSGNNTEMSALGNPAAIKVSTPRSASTAVAKMPKTAVFLPAMSSSSHVNS